MNANKTLLPTTIFLISSTLSPQLTPFCLLALIFSSFIQNSAHRTSHARNVNGAAERMREREDFVVDDGESRAIGRGGGGGFHYCSSFFSSWAVFVFRAAAPHRVFAARSSPRIPGGEVVVVAISGTTAGQGRSGAEGTVHARNGDAGEGDVRPRRAAIARERGPLPASRRPSANIERRERGAFFGPCCRDLVGRARTKRPDDASIEGGPPGSLDGFSRSVRRVLRPLVRARIEFPFVRFCGSERGGAEGGTEGKGGTGGTRQKSLLFWENGTKRASLWRGTRR